MSTPDYFSRKVSTGRVRTAGTPNSPQTPLLNRNLSSFYNSPGGGFRNDEENNVVVDLGARFLRIGIAGETTPRCVLDFNPNEQRRVGDYRHWMPASGRNGIKRKRGQDLGQDWELYSNDVKALDLGLVGDKLDRACRKADGEILMLDERKRRLTVAVSSLLPRPVLAVVLETLFDVFQALSIILLPTPIPALVASGLRTGVVLDIGWSETVATVIFEYREVLQRRSSRAGRLLSEETYRLLDAVCSEQKTNTISVSFEDAQEVLTRLVWCRSSDEEGDQEHVEQSADLNVSLPSEPSTSISVPFQKLSEPTQALFASPTEAPNATDIDEAPIPHLLFNALLALPIDIRKVCTSRLIITGGSARIPGLKSRILKDLQRLVQERGWDAVRNYGKVHPKISFLAVRQNRTSDTDSAYDSKSDFKSRPEGSPEPLDGEGEAAANSSVPAASDSQTSVTIPPSQRSQEPDAILEKINAHNKKQGAPEPVEGEFRLVESLGAWAGASLMASLRIKGVVEIERDAFLRDGLYGAQGALVKESSEGERKKEARKSLGAGKAAAEKGFSLGIWA